MSPIHSKIFHRLHVNLHVTLYYRLQHQCKSMPTFTFKTQLYNATTHALTFKTRIEINKLKRYEIMSK